MQNKNNNAASMEGDAWVLSFFEAENRLLQGKNRGETLLQSQKYYTL